MNSLQNFNYNGAIIQRRQDDGYLNLTQMCQANGKQVGDFLRLKTTKAYLVELSTETGILVTELYKASKGGDGDQGTWGHPSLAKKLQDWIDKANRRNKNVMGSIYVFVDNGNNAYKVGFTTDLVTRHKQHKTSNPFLELIAEYPNQSVESEILIHEKLSSYRIKGTTEWYRKNPKVLRIIKFLLAEYSCRLPSEAWNLTASIRENGEQKEEYLADFDA